MCARLAELIKACGVPIAHAASDSPERTVGA